MSPFRAPHASLDDLLRDVSRSFYLSIRLLPGNLRAPVAAAYLLARATDTVADSSGATQEHRRDMLLRLTDAVSGMQIAPGLAAEAGQLAEGLPHAGERELLLRLPEVFGACTRLSAEDRYDVQVVLRHIMRGQYLDVERFGGAGPVQALPHADALHEYAYLVAGSVGEFWTDLCARHERGWADHNHARMRELGRSFGMGLQLVNIVRDVGEDLAAGRCYLPADELAEAGLTPDGIVANPEAFMPTWRRWQDAAAAGLADGMAYAQAVRVRRIRAAVALPAILGRDTLTRLRAAGASALASRVRVPRESVRNLLLRMALGFAGRETLQREWDNRAR